MVMSHSFALAVFVKLRSTSRSSPTPSLEPVPSSTENWKSKLCPVSAVDGRLPPISTLVLAAAGKRVAPGVTSIGSSAAGLAVSTAIWPVSGSAL